jgi:uncharacterized protein (TIGR00255 family)
MLSMTGYGRGAAALGSSQVTVDVRAVNHRFLEVRLHLPPELLSEAAAIEDCVRQSVQRGRVDVNARLEGPLPGAVILDVSRAQAAFEALRTLRDQLAPNEPLPLGLLASVPGLFREGGVHGDDQREAACLEATQAACRQLTAMRRSEGERLGEDLLGRVERVVERLDALAPDLANLTGQQRDKLRVRLSHLLAGSNTSLDPGRLEHEIALLADRADITEELTRLRVHASALAQLLAAETPEGVGHRLDFLLQEMGREANTAAAKLPDAAATQAMIEIKAELLRMREQVQNVL